jgi:hypothetical protein
MGCMKMIDKELRFTSNLGVQLSEGIHLYKNFYPGIDDLESSLNEFNESDWNIHGNYEANDHDNSFWNGRLSPDFIDKKFHDYIINFLSPEYWILAHGNFIRLMPEEICGVQNNSIPEEFPYILSYYAGDFNGGSITFLDSDIEYKPERNDLIIFKPQSIDIGTVHSGVRYSYLDYLIKHPGYIMV